MNERAIADALASLTDQERQTATVEAIRPVQYAQPQRDDVLTPSVEKIKGKDGTMRLKVMLPPGPDPELETFAAGWQAGQTYDPRRDMLP